MTSPLIVTVKEGTASNSGTLPTAFRQIERWAADPTNAMLMNYRARYGMAGAFTVGGAAALKYDTKVYDTRNSYSTSTGLFTCMYPGFYAVRCSVAVEATGAGQTITIFAMKNNVEDSQGEITAYGSAVVWVELNTEILCKGQDQLGVQVSSSAAGLTGRNAGSETFVVFEYRGG